MLFRTPPSRVSGASTPTYTSIKRNTKTPRVRRTRRFEQLESRALLAATPLALGFGDTEQMEMVVREAIGIPGEVDRFAVELNPGDVIGATVQAHGQLDPTISLIGSDDTLLWFNDDHSSLGSSSFMSHESPLPRLNSNSTDSILQYVIDQPGTYFIDVGAAAGSTGSYGMELVLARPGMEAEPVGATQMLYVDFDGATVQTSRFLNGSGLKRLSPLQDFLQNWGLTGADEDAVIDVVLDTIRENLSTDVRDSGINGDFSQSATPGEFNIQILNSRDDPEFDDQFGDHPYLSRVVVGGTTAETGLFTVAKAEGVDVGNFNFTDDAVVMLDWISAPAGAHPASLNQYDVHPSSSKIELVGTALGVLASHEASHNVGNWHTDQLSPSPNIMDTRPVRHLVPDGIFGAPGGEDLDFGVDALADDGATLAGQVNTLNVISFALSTGTQANLGIAPAAAVGLLEERSVLIGLADLNSGPMVVRDAAPHANNSPNAYVIELASDLGSTIYISGGELNVTDSGYSLNMKENGDTDAVITDLVFSLCVDDLSNVLFGPVI